MPADYLALARLELGNGLVDELSPLVLDGLDLRVERRPVGDDRLESRSAGKHGLVERDRGCCDGPCPRRRQPRRDPLPRPARVGSADVPVPRRARPRRRSGAGARRSASAGGSSVTSPSARCGLHDGHGNARTSRTRRRARGRSRRSHQAGRALLLERGRRTGVRGRGSAPRASARSRGCRRRSARASRSPLCAARRSSVSSCRDSAMSTSAYEAIEVALAESPDSAQTWFLELLSGRRYSARGSSRRSGSAFRRSRAQERADCRERRSPPRLPSARRSDMPPRPIESAAKSERRSKLGVALAMRVAGGLQSQSCLTKATSVASTSLTAPSSSGHTLPR